MRILILNQFFDPEPTPKGLAFAKGLVAHGHEVEVLTGFPNCPGGKVYDGYKISLYEQTIVEGIRVHRVALYPSHDRSAWRRIANYGSFALSAATVGALRIQKPDLVFVYHPPLTVSLPAAVIGWLKNAPFVYEIQDIWPDTVATTGMLTHPLLLGTIGYWAKRVYARAARVVVISDGFRDLLIDRGVPRHKIDVVRNWSEEGRLVLQTRDPALLKELGLEGRFNLMFAGTQGLAQALDPVLDAAKISLQNAPKIQYVFMGGGVDKERLKERAKRLGLTNVKFFAQRPVQDMGRMLPLADALLVHLRDDPLFHVTIPSKTQAYLYAGVPIITATRGDAAKMVRDAGAGIVCEPENAQSIASAVAAMANLSKGERDAMGKSGQCYYDRHLSMRVGLERYCQIFERVISGGPASR